MSKTVTKPSLAGMLADLRAGRVVDATAIYINGQWTASDGDGTIQVFSPADESVIALVAEGSVSDVDKAVAAARAALPAWAALPPARRADYLQRVSDLLMERLEEFGELASRDVGAPLEMHHAVELPGASDCLEGCSRLRSWLHCGRQAIRSGPAARLRPCRDIR